MSLFTTFNFHVLFTLPDSSDTVCQAEFSECSGLEMNTEVKTIKEGGNNGEQIHLSGPITYGQLTLKRGMTSNFDLWDWFERVQEERNLRVDGEIQLLAQRKTQKNVVFKVFGCLPIKMVAPSLMAKEGDIAIEEIQLAYERLQRDSSSQGGANA